MKNVMHYALKHLRSKKLHHYRFVVMTFFVLLKAQSNCVHQRVTIRQYMLICEEKKRSLRAVTVGVAMDLSTAVFVSKWTEFTSLAAVAQIVGIKIIPTIVPFANVSTHPLHK